MTILNSSEIHTTDSLVEVIENAPEGLICLASEAVANCINENEIAGLMQTTDVLHSGLSFHEGIPFSYLQLCAFNWNFLNADKAVKAVSWKPTLDFVVFDKALYKNIGGLDRGYVNPMSSLFDFAYSVMIRGGNVMHIPLPERLTIKPPANWKHYIDEGRFIIKYINSKGFRFYQIALLILERQWISYPKCVREKKQMAPFAFKLTDRVRDLKINSYSALIPTINRYEYIERSIESLMRLSFPPSEIIVVDQTPEEKRNMEIYKPYIDKGILKLIFRDRPGQSSARNEGIQMASCDWILLFEDDAEAWPEMVNEHIRLLNHSIADVSTGVVVSPGEDGETVPEENRIHSLTDIFTTGNAFLAKETALSVGGFDPAFDLGPGADDDFGKRLYLSGKKIIYNYKSIETHYKAPKGGMREHGAWWRNKSSFWGAFPPATQLYAIRKYYPRKIRIFLVLSILLKAKKRYSIYSYILLLLLLPFKFCKSWKQANALTAGAKG